jgi:hypothetical protein
LKLGTVAILNQNPIFEVGSNLRKQFDSQLFEESGSFFFSSLSCPRRREATLTWGFIDLDCLKESENSLTLFASRS